MTSPSTAQISPRLGKGTLPNIQKVQTLPPAGFFLTNPGRQHIQVSDRVKFCPAGLNQFVLLLIKRYSKIPLAVVVQFFSHIYGGGGEN